MYIEPPINSDIYSYECEVGYDGTKLFEPLRLPGKLIGFDQIDIIQSHHHVPRSKTFQQVFRLNGTKRVPYLAYDNPYVALSALNDAREMISLANSYRHIAIQLAESPEQKELIRDSIINLNKKRYTSARFSLLNLLYSEN